MGLFVILFLKKKQIYILSSQFLSTATSLSIHWLPGNSTAVTVKYMNNQPLFSMRGMRESGFFFCHRWDITDCIFNLHLHCVVMSSVPGSVWWKEAAGWLCASRHLWSSLWTLCFLLPLSVDVTEVQILIIIMYLLAAVGGSAFWQSLVIVIGFNSSRLRLMRLMINMCDVFVDI